MFPCLKILNNNFLCVIVVLYAHFMCRCSEIVYGCDVYMYISFSLQHLHIMEEMLKDYTLGDHLLLVGNQGVGKNKITDRFLQLLNLPREYLQLHR